MALFTPLSINFVLRCGTRGVSTGSTRGVGAGTRGILVESVSVLVVLVESVLALCVSVSLVD